MIVGLLSFWSLPVWAVADCCIVEGACQEISQMQQSCSQPIDCISTAVCPQPTTVDPNAPDSDVKWEPVMPKLQIKIPTLQPFTSEGLQKADIAGYAYIPFLGQYIAGIYKWAVLVGAIVATIMILFGGLMYIISHGDAAQISSAKERIQGALIGLFILLGSYIMLYIINPDLVTFKSLKVQVIDRKTFTVEDEADSVEGSAPSSIAVVSGDNISNPAGKQLTPEMIEAVQQAAKSLKTVSIKLYITDGYRSLEDQKRLILLNCKNAPGADKCDPKPGKPNTCVLKGLKPESCPHTTARAVDLWGFKNGRQCIMQSQCKKGSDDPCRQDPCQSAVIQAMKNAGFCNLSSEAWHFEKPKMSSTCN